MKTIANTTILSNFAAVDSFHLLQTLHGRLYIPIQVYEEVLAGLEEGYDFYAGIKDHVYPVSHIGWIELVSMTDEQEIACYQSLTQKLHHGEAACLAIAQHRNWAFLTDDKQARKIARDLGIVLSGTLGALVQAVARNIITLESGNDLLYKMVARGYHSPYERLDVLLSDGF